MQGIHFYLGNEKKQRQSFLKSKDHHPLDANYIRQFEPNSKLITLCNMQFSKQLCMIV